MVNAVLRLVRWVMKKLHLTSSGVVTSGRKHVQLPKGPKPMKQDDKLFLEALDQLLAKHRTALVDELVSKIREIPIAMVQESDTITRRQQVTLPSEKTDIEIDETTFVVQQKLNEVEKGFETLTEAKTTQDAEASKSISKLRSLKKGSE